MRPAVTLAYRGRSDARPPWVTRLGTTSIVLGTLGLVVGPQRWAYALMFLDPDYHGFLHPPAAWVWWLHLAAVLAATPVSVALIAAGVASLVKPALGLRLHLWYAAIKLPLAALSAVVRALTFWPHPDVDGPQLAMEMLVEGIFGTYAAFVLLFVLRQTRARNRTARPPRVR